MAWLHLDWEAKGMLIEGAAVPNRDLRLCRVCHGVLVCWQGSSFHRVIPGFMCQGGDFTVREGPGSGRLPAACLLPLTPPPP